MTDRSATIEELAEAAPEFMPPADAATAKPQNTAATLGSFLDAPRDPLQYHITGVLPERGKVTISAVAKGFKTTFLIELGMCMANGNCTYLNFDLNNPSPVLLVQPELSDALLAERLSWILRTVPDWLDVARVRQNFHILPTEHGRPALWEGHPRCEQSRNELERAICDTGAKVLLVDSLYMTFAGMDENAADSMTLALDYLASLTTRFGVAIILVHHFNKSGTAARGSSVYQGWGETDLAIYPVEGEAVVKAEALMRCAFPKGFPAYWKRPDESSAWFELMPEDWEPEKPSRGRKVQYPPTIVSTVLRAGGPEGMRWSPLRDQIIDSIGCSRGKAEELIKLARERGFVLNTQGLYTVVEGGTK